MVVGEVSVGEVVGDNVVGSVDVVVEGSVGVVVGDDVEGVAGGVVVVGWARAAELVVKAVAAKTNTAVAVKRAALRCGCFISK
ncbi:hypothetical protein AB0M22_31445 [Nocardia sp. NPDC051756]|uniref:hypothetical protein n=1 Tax=Nocardia sp. NPDC051756 TaxID=3154751 RepID=UPI003417BBEE